MSYVLNAQLSHELPYKRRHSTTSKHSLHKQESVDHQDHDHTAQKAPLATPEKVLLSAPEYPEDGKEPKPQEEPQNKVFNLKFYVAVVCLVIIFMMMETNQRIALLTTLEKRFGFTSVENGIIMSSYDVGHVIVLIILSVIGNKIHKPRACGIGGICAVLSCLVWLSPHIIFGPGVLMTPLTKTGIWNTSNSPSEENPYRLCNSVNTSYDGGSLDMCSAIEMEFRNSTTSGAHSKVETWTAFALFFLSQSLLGVALAPFLTVAIAYIDDNTDAQTSAAYVGLMMSMGGFGSVLGFILGAFTLKAPVDLKPTEFTQADPEWVGAWWLGSIVSGFFMLVVCLPLFCFPRSLLHQHAAVTESEKAHLALEDSPHKEGEESPHHHENFKERVVKRVTSITEPVKALPKKSKPLLTNVIFVCCTIAMAAVMYLAGGLFVFLPKYFEIQFSQQPTIANIITSVVTVGAMALGTFTGGYIAAYFELERKGNAKLNLVAVTIGIVCFAGTLFIGCGQQTVAGTVEPGGVLNASMACNLNCTECGLEFNPVCGGDDKLYYSACYAGCSSVSSVEGDIVTYANCSCPESAEKPISGMAKTGMCDIGCKTLIPYAILMFCCNFIVCLASSPFMALLIRSVEPKQKAMALGLNNIGTSIFGTIPAPIIYGRLVDSACQLYAPTCGEEGGFCIMYSNQLFRFYLHGLTVIMVIVADLALVISLVKVTREERQAARQGREQAAVDAPEQLPMVEGETRT